jgi:hypothetical protein
MTGPEPGSSDAEAVEVVLLQAFSEAKLWVELRYLDDPKTRHAPGAYAAWEYLCDLLDEQLETVFGASK